MTIDFFGIKYNHVFPTILTDPEEVESRFNILK